jgi:hypothetical protein
MLAPPRDTVPLPRLDPVALQATWAKSDSDVRFQNLAAITPVPRTKTFWEWDAEYNPIGNFGASLSHR